MSCATSTLKFSAFIMNLMCFILGLLIVIAGSYALATFENTPAIRTPCIVGITLGSVLLLTTILGCLGALRESARLSWIYFLIMVLILIAQIVTTLVIPVNFEEVANETINNAWNRELTVQGAMEKYEIFYECCGKKGPEDYANSGLKIPASCYKAQNATSSSNLYTSGCVDKLHVAFLNGTQIEEISDWTLVGIEALTVIIAFFLARTFTNAERRRLF